MFRSSVLALPLVLALVGCGDDTGGAGGSGSGGAGSGGSDATATTDASTTSGGDDGCAGLCTGAGFDDGTETDFGGGLVECLCSGEGDGIEKADCEAYCAELDVAPEDALLGEDVSPNDKCACDGT